VAWDAYPDGIGEAIWRIAARLRRLLRLEAKSG
jgi:hypothetical protein